MKINGNLTFHTLGAGEIQNVILETMTTAARLGAATASGRIVYDSDESQYYYHNGTTWIAFATGGDASALQAEVDAIEAASGGVFGATGAYGGATVDAALTNVTSSTDLLDALTQLDAAISAAAGVDTLPELTDVTITSVTDNEVLAYDTTSGQWINQTATEAGLASSGDLATHVADESLHLTAAQNTLLDGIAGTVTATEINYLDGVTSPIQTQLDAKQASDAGLTSLAGLTGSGIVVQTADDSFVLRTLVETSTDALTITNPDGAAGNPTLNIDAGLESIAGLVTGADNMIYTTGADTYAVTTLTAAGRSLLDDATAADQRTTLGLVAGGAGDIWVEKAGDVMTGFLTLSGAPTNDLHAATKAYVDSLVSGLTWKNSTLAATTANIDLATGGLLTIDGIPTSAGDRILVKDQTNAAENGIYIVVDGGAWTRSTDFDQVTNPDEINSAAVFVEEGAVYADTMWTVTSTVTTLNTDDIVFTQFNGSAGAAAGAGLEKVGNVLNVNMGAGIVELPSDEVGLDLYDSVTGALILTEDGSTQSTGTDAALYLLLDANGTMSQSGSGLTVATGGITNTQVNASAGIEFSKLESLSSAQIIVGSGTNVPTAVAVTGDVTIDSNGVTTIGTGTVENSMLVNSSVTIAADTGIPETLSLGQTLTIAGGTGISSVVSATDTVTLNLVASINDLTDVVISSPVADNILMYNGTQWVNSDVSAVLDQATTNDFSDVTAAPSAAGQVLVATDGTNYTPSQIQYIDAIGVASTTWTVTHNLGQKFVNVTVYDSTDQVIIPQSITATDANTTTITFNTAITGTAVVMGVPGVVVS